MIKIFKIIIIIIFLFPVSQIYSQTLYKFGIKGGLNFSGLSTSDDAKNVFYDSSAVFNLLTFDIGIFAELFNFQRFCVSAELHYLTKVENNPNLNKQLILNSSNHGEFYSYEYLSDRLHYLSLQLLPRYRFVITDEDELYFMGGPEFDYLTGYSNSENDNIIAMKNGTISAGGILGFGGEYHELITFDFKYEHDFTNTYKISYGDKSVSRKSSSISFVAGISLSNLFGITKKVKKPKY